MLVCFRDADRRGRAMHCVWLFEGCLLTPICKEHGLLQLANVLLSTLEMLASMCRFLATKSSVSDRRFW